MRLLVTHPELTPGLVEALNQTDCVAARTGSHTLEVFAPWLLDGGEPAQAATEVLFFVRAWGSAHPDFRATLLDPR
jgi:hypothetical protein